MSAPVPPAGDVLLVRSAARGLARQVTVVVAAAMVLLVLVVAVLVVRAQSRSTDTLLRGTVSSADDVGDPPPGAWLVLGGGGTVRRSPGLPAELEPALTRARAAAGPALRLQDLHDRHGQYRLATQLRNGRTVQVVLDLAAEQRQRTLLLRAAALASLLALGLAAGVGLFLARRAVRPLVQALSLQRAFVADASHELRTPLTLLSTRTQLLDRAVQAAADMDDRARADSRGVLHDVQRLGEVVEDLLVAADPRGEQRREPVDLGVLIGSVVDSARAHAEQAGVQLCATGGAGHDVLGSPVGLRRALLALVDNAVDHTPAGGRVQVSCSGSGSPGTVTVRVADTGPGIAAQDTAGVLRRFSSGGHRAGRTHYGLGLALTHDVANRHGGHLRLVPTAVGATFELALPRTST